MVLIPTRLPIQSMAPPRTTVTTSFRQSKHSPSLSRTRLGTQRRMSLLLMSLMMSRLHDLIPQLSSQRMPPSFPETCSKTTARAPTPPLSRRLTSRGWRSSFNHPGSHSMPMHWVPTHSSPTALGRSHLYPHPAQRH